MNIIIVARALPYPPDVGVKIRLFNLIKHLSTKHSISLVCYREPDEREGVVDCMRKYCESIRLVHRKRRSKRRQLPGLTKDLISGVPWNVKYAKSREMEDSIRGITTNKKFDILHVDDIYMASNVHIGSGGSMRKCVTFHDIDSVLYRRSLKVEKNPYERLKMFLNWLALRSWEKRIAENFDLNIVVSSLDCGLLKERSGQARVVVIPNGTDTDSFRPLPKNDGQHSVAFFGNMAYRPNKDAAIYFCREIFPLIRRRIAHAKFLVVGRDPSEELRKLASDPNVIVTGYVEDVVPYYQESSVVVVPLRAGSGTRGKILEAMALGRPVVSTSLGAEGLMVTHKDNIMIADRSEDFAAMTVELMRNGIFKSALIESARKFVECHHSWRKIAESLDQAYREISAGTSAPL